MISTNLIHSKYSDTIQTIKQTDVQNSELLKSNDYLIPFAHIYDKIRQNALDFIDKVDQNEGGLINFSKGYHKYGFNFDPISKELIFREWLPEAQEVYLIGDFNNWDLNQYPLKKNQFGVWEARFNNDQFKLLPDQKYKLYLKNAKNEWKYRNSAYSEYQVQNEQTLVYDAVYIDKTDYKWKHPTPILKEKLKIYECHIGMSTEKKGVSTFKDFQNDILPRIHQNGYNAIQIMAVAEHAYYGCFGYHVTGFYAVSSRFGTPQNFQDLVDSCHKLGMLVFLDIVHSHFSSNTLEGLAELDGTDYQYSHSGEKGKHRLWDSLTFDYSKYEVVRFLLSNIHFWIERYNIDGFRFDGITSMLYTHHGLLIRNQHWFYRWNA